MLRANQIMILSLLSLMLLCPSGSAMASDGAVRDVSTILGAPREAPSARGTP